MTSVFQSKCASLSLINMFTSWKLSYNHIINSSSEYEKTMQKSWADVAEDETWNTL